MRGFKLAERRGTATVEMAVILPLLILLVLGATDLGRVFYDAIAVANAARAGLSYGALDVSKSKDTSTISQIASKDAEFIGGVTINVSRFCECDDTSVVDCETGTCDEGSSKIYLQVQAEKTYNTILPYPGIPSSVLITRDAYMRAR